MRYLSYDRLLFCLLRSGSALQYSDVIQGGNSPKFSENFRNFPKLKVDYF